MVSDGLTRAAQGDEGTDTLQCNSNRKATRFYFSSNTPVDRVLPSRPAQEGRPFPLYTIRPYRRLCSAVARPPRSQSQVGDVGLGHLSRHGGTGVLVRLDVRVQVLRCVRARRESGRYVPSW